jgi:hypothetical protein
MGEEKVVISLPTERSQEFLIGLCNHQCVSSAHFACFSQIGCHYAPRTWLSTVSLCRDPSTRFILNLGAVRPLWFSTKQTPILLPTR